MKSGDAITPDQFRRCRLALEMSQARMAQAIGLRGTTAGRTVRRYESDKDPLNAEGSVAMALELVMLQAAQDGNERAAKVVSALWGER